MSQKFKHAKSCKVIFTDFFDTLVHRTVHPNYTIKLWAKFLVRELGLYISSDQLFSIRLDSISYLSKKIGLKGIEISYDTVIKEIYSRLINSQQLENTSLASFSKICKQADYISEISVQFTNNETLNALKELKKNGAQIYLITDFFR